MAVEMASNRRGPRRVLHAAGSVVMQAGERVRDWGLAQAQGLAAHPARLIWTLLITLAYLAAAHPLLHYDHAFWWHAKSWFQANYQVDYGEGPMFNQEVLLYHGINIYRADTAPPFIVGNYPPVFPLVASLFMRHYGLTFTAGRLVSSLAIMGAAIVAGLIVLQATRQVLAAFIAGGLLPTFVGIYSWGPFNRVDSLALFWSLCTVLVVLRYAGTRKVWLAVPLAVLTVYTRQSLVDGVFAAYLYLLFRDWKRGIAVGVVTLAAMGVVFWGLQVWSHGAFYVNTVIDNENAWNWGGTVGNWHQWMGQGGRFVFRLGLAGAATGLLATGGILWPVWLAAATGVFATIGKTGAAVNYFFPIYAAAAVCLGIFIGGYRRFFRRAPFFLWPLELLLPAMLFLFIHGQPPKWAAHVPLLPRAEALVGSSTLARAQVAHTGKRGDLGARNPGNEQMIRLLQGVQGPVLSLDFPSAVQVQAGHPMQWQPFELGTVHDDGRWDGQAFVQSINARHYAVIFFHDLNGVRGYVHGALAAQIVLAVEANYTPATTVAGYQVWRPASGVGGVAGVLLPLAASSAVAKAPTAVATGVALPRDEPKPEARGAFAEVDIYKWLNTQGVITPGKDAAAGQSFDANGSSFSAALFPKPGTLSVVAAGAQVPFLIPKTGTGLVSSLDLAAGATIALPPQRDSVLWLLEAGVNGPQTVPLTLHYTSGADQQVQVPFSDWCVPGGPPEYPAYTAPYRLDAHGQQTTPACGVYALRVRVDGARALATMALGPDSDAMVLAVTSEKA
ncbi:MAG TPA: hypothetical protein VNM16_03340 [Bacillota bacterium]|nr:hypothetical protein [Bacillota bacterium]